MSESELEGAADVATRMPRVLQTYEVMVRMSTIRERLAAVREQRRPVAVYYEGGTVDRFWVAPSDLDAVESREQRVSRLYRTRMGAAAFAAGLMIEHEQRA